jgi:hypothetical protein
MQDTVKKAVEVGNEMLSAKTERLEVKGIGTLAMLKAAELAGEPVPPSVTELTSYAITRHRANVHKVPVSDWVIAWVAYLIDRPAIGMLYLAAIKAISARHVGATVTLEEFTSHFPNGFPTADEYRRVWDGQKARGAGFGSNSLDVFEAWE